MGGDDVEMVEMVDRWNGVRRESSWGRVGGSRRVEEPMLVGMGVGGDGAVYSVVGA